MASRLIASNAGPITGDLLEDSKYFKQFEALKSENSQKSSVQKITVSQKSMITSWTLTLLDQRSRDEDDGPEKEANGRFYTSPSASITEAGSDGG